MKIDLISDTHSKHKEFDLKGGDILIHSGDATIRGRSREIHAFLTWFSKQPYTHKIFVPGNHDAGFETETAMYRGDCANLGITLLIDQAIVIDGVKIYGSPYTPTFSNWYFMRDRGEALKQHWDAIPDDTQVLITHGPAYQIKDWVKNRSSPEGENVGCVDLRARIEQLVDLRLHVFGHIHDQAGTRTIGKYIAANAALLNDEYKNAYTPITISVDNGEYAVLTNKVVK